MLAPFRILIVKLTSLGDVIKTLPVVDDIRRQIPGAAIDWVVERPCDALLALHPGIDRVIPLELRRYRLERRYWHGLRAALPDLGCLRARRYDRIIDLQGRMKSALVAGLARGPVTGPAPGPTSEPGYQHFYQALIARDKFAGRNAVTSNRVLCAEALGYDVPANEPHYGLQPDRLHLGTPAIAQLIPSHRFAVLIHGSSRSEKCWPEPYWIETGRALARKGIACLLPWGNAAEAERAHRLAGAIDGAAVPALPVPLVTWTSVLTAATVVVGVDSGLTHLATACGAPTVTIFTATQASIFGASGLGTPELGAPELGAPELSAPHHSRCCDLGDAGVTVTSAEVMTAVETLLADAPQRAQGGQPSSRAPIAQAVLTARACPVKQRAH